LTWFDCCRDAFYWAGSLLISLIDFNWKITHTKNWFKKKEHSKQTNSNSVVESDICYVYVFVFLNCSSRRRISR
jgi:hypothetical protein